MDKGVQSLAQVQNLTGYIVYPPQLHKKPLYSEDSSA